jgi:hypothetical protein
MYISLIYLLGRLLRIIRLRWGTQALQVSNHEWEWEGWVLGERRRKGP